MKYIKRILNIDLPSGQSAFLWGPRKTGKSTYLKRRFPNSLIYDFLKTDLFLEYSKRPSLLRERLLAKDDGDFNYPVILDEVQKIPQILDEVHWLIENRGPGNLREERRISLGAEPGVTKCFPLSRVSWKNWIC